MDCWWEIPFGLNGLNEPFKSSSNTGGTYVFPTLYSKYGHVCTIDFNRHCGYRFVAKFELQISAKLKNLY